MVRPCVPHVSRRQLECSRFDLPTYGVQPRRLGSRWSCDPARRRYLYKLRKHTARECDYSRNYGAAIGREDMTETGGFRMSQGFDVLPPRSGNAYPIPCEEWDDLKARASRLSNELWVF